MHVGVASYLNIKLGSEMLQLNFSSVYDNPSQVFYVVLLFNVVNWVLYNIIVLFVLKLKFFFLQFLIFYYYIYLFISTINKLFRFHHTKNYAYKYLSCHSYDNKSLIII